MSTTMESVIDTSTKPRKEKKEKKSKKATSSAPDEVTSAIGTLPESAELMPGDIAEDTPTTNKKRKREPLPDEIEVDVALPEPPSKKALRRLKKRKPVELTATSLANRAIANDTSDLNETTPAEPNADSTAADTPRPVHGIWIGNLPFGATKTSLRDFLIANASTTSISAASITRIHMPVPHNAASSRTREKPQNKGYAYVDFASKDALDAALALSESTLGGRKVLIKDAKSYAGRPEKSKDTTSTGNSTSTGASATTAQGRTRAALEGTLKSTKRIFVGNLGFDVTKEDLSAHFGKCGTIEDIHMATFEDSGKCKGFAWVRFEAVEAAESAVRGWVRIAEGGDDGDDGEENADGTGNAAPEDEEAAPAAAAKPSDDSPDSDSDSDSSSSSTAATAKAKTSAPSKAKTTPRPKKQNTRKWFVNRLLGRPLRCEFAEDASVRYKKRFGNKDRDAAGPDARPHNTYQNRAEAGDAAGEGGAADSGEAAYKARGANAAPRGKRAGPREMQPGGATDVSRRRGKAGDGEEVGERKEQKFKDSGDAGSRYRTGAIAEAKGKKVTFD